VHGGWGDVWELEFPAENSKDNLPDEN
jgi:hypothetical protein